MGKKSNSDPSRGSASLQRPRVAGKFLYVGDEKFWVRGVTYGPFRADPTGNEYRTPEVAGRDLLAVQYERDHVRPPLPRASLERRFPEYLTARNERARSVRCEKD